jgi:glycosyltransferase involved in cell wall biosynthesis
MDKPLISFVIPVYNRLDLLKESLASVLSSGFDDLEVILIDDASSWKGHEKLLEFIKENKKILYIREEENRGPGAARNRGMAAARGDWLFFMDSDDVIYGRLLPELAAFLKTAGDADMVVFAEVMFRFADGSLKKIQIGGNNADGWLDKLFTWQHSIYDAAEAWNYCCRKTLLAENDIIFPETYYSEDVCVSFSAACHAKKTLIFPHCFYEHRIGGTLSLVTLIIEAGTEKKMVEGRKSVFARLARLCESDIPADRKERVERLLYRSILYSLYEPDVYRQNKSVCLALNILHEQVILYTGNRQKNIYISPCFLEAAATAGLLAEFAGRRISGFIDRDKSSPRARNCQKESGINVYSLSDIGNFDDSVILVFGIHADEIARGFEDRGLIENINFVKTGLM